MEQSQSTMIMIIIIMNKLIFLHETNKVLLERRKLIDTNKALEFKVGLYNILGCNKHVCVLDIVELRKVALYESHERKLSIRVDKNVLRKKKQKDQRKKRKKNCRKKVVKLPIKLYPRRKHIME